MPDTQRLRCVHCHTTETPLWRTGPDGPRSLCNACGVRFKKGKLILYKDENGNLTAVKRQDSLPVHVPPPAKKSNKRCVPSPSPSSPSSPVDSSVKRVVRKVPSETTLQTNPALGKKPRSRIRRVNAGQLPGRYASCQFPFDSANQHSWRSPTDSPVSSPSSPANSPRVSADRSTTLTTSSSFVTDDFNPLNRNSLSDEDHLFSDMACLGLDASANTDNNILLPMPVDPSSAEQFTFAFSGLGRDAYLAFDAPDRAEALRALLLDRTRNVSQLYDSTIQALSHLHEYRQKNRSNLVGSDSEGSSLADECKEFVRSFARVDMATIFSDGFSGPCEQLCVSESESNVAAVMLFEKTLHSTAVEKLRALFDSTELVGFAEACLIELLAEDVCSASKHRSLSDYDQSLTCRHQLSDPKLSRPKPVPTTV